VCHAQSIQQAPDPDDLMARAIGRLDATIATGGPDATAASIVRAIVTKTS